MITESIDRLFLELSQFTRANTRRELELKARIENLTLIFSKICLTYNDPSCGAERERMEKMFDLSANAHAFAKSPLPMDGESS